jgi:hypothetical protein
MTLAPARLIFKTRLSSGTPKSLKAVNIFTGDSISRTCRRQKLSGVVALELEVRRVPFSPAGARLRNAGANGVSTRTAACHDTLWGDGGTLKLATR